MNKNIIEIVTFNVKQGVSEEKLLEASFLFGKMLEKQINGFVKRTLAKYNDNDKWLEMIWWDSMASAQGALETATKTKEFDIYNALIEEEGSEIVYLQEK